VESPPAQDSKPAVPEVVLPNEPKPETARQHPGGSKKSHANPMTVIANLPKRKHPAPAHEEKESSGATTTQVANQLPEKSQGEAAKDQLMKALYIASTLINEAKDGAIGGKD
jgi:hypothetical protein